MSSSGRCGCRARRRGAEVTAAVEGFNALPQGGPIARPDVLIVARGGGSLEDLWGFNDEALARAVAASHIPVISAVGHETDWTLIDLAADMRAPTPTGAAEMAVPVKADLEATLASLSARLRACTTRNFDRKRTALRAAMRALPSPDQLLALPRRRFDEATSRLGRALTVSTERKRARLGAIRLTPATLSRRIGEARRASDRDFSRAQNALSGLVRERRAHFRRIAARLSPEPVARRNRRAAESLDALVKRGDQAIGFRLERLRARLTQAERLLSTLKLSDEAILERGYALVMDADGTVLRRAADVSPGTELSLRFADGAAGAIATGDAARPKPSPKPAGKAEDAGQPGIAVLRPMMNNPHLTTPSGKPRARSFGIAFDGEPGPSNAITDVPGVSLGYTTLISGDGPLVVGKGPVRTGVTAILPRPRERAGRAGVCRHVQPERQWRTDRLAPDRGTRRVQFSRSPSPTPIPAA